MKIGRIWLFVGLVLGWDIGIEYIGFKSEQRRRKISIISFSKILVLFYHLQCQFLFTKNSWKPSKGKICKINFKIRLIIGSYKSTIYRNVISYFVRNMNIRLFLNSWKPSKGKIYKRKIIRILELNILQTQKSKKVCIQTQVCKYRPTLSPCNL